MLKIFTYFTSTCDLQLFKRLIESVFTKTNITPSTTLILSYLKAIQKKNAPKEEST